MKTVWILVGLGLSLLVTAIQGVAQEEYVPKPDEELCGTWVDDQATSETYKWVISSDGTFLEFWRGYAQPYWKARYSIDRKWTDEDGNIFYQCTSRWGFQPWKASSVIETWFTLFRIETSGDKLHSVWSQRAMPTDFVGNIQPRTFRRE